jgi:hypothetical protein
MMVLPSKRLVESLAKRMDDSFFTDTATVNYRTVASLDGYGQPTYTTTSTEVSCSFTDKPAKETWANYADIETIEAEIRFKGTKPGKGDTVTLTHRFNRTDSDDQDFTADTFEIIAIRDRDAFGYICGLKVVQV